MALDGTAAGLRASIADWLDDTTLTASIPDFIVMAEARLNRLLNVPGQEARSTAPVSGEYLALPVDVNGIRRIHIAGSPNIVLDQMAAADMLDLYAGFAPGRPRAYSLVAGQLQFAPVPDATYSVEITYLKDLPPLASNTTNWLLTANPDCYLYGALLAAEMRGWNDDRLPMLKAAFDASIAEIVKNGEQLRWGSAPLYPRIKRLA